MRFGLDKIKKFPVMEFLELIMPQIDEEFMLVPVEDDDLKGRAAETIPAEHMIRVKQSVYDAACQGCPRYVSRSPGLLRRGRRAQCVLFRSAVLPALLI